MSFWSISFAYRLGLGFHAMNNEGADGSNLMQPRRIDVGKTTYDGISGEIIRHHILENFVNACHERQISMLPMSAGLHPDRGPIGIRAAARQLNFPNLSNENLYQSVRNAVLSCAVLDVGGFLAAWQELQGDKYVAERTYIQANCAELHKEGNRISVEVVKRDSCFDVAWMISELPQDITVTQHSAYRDTFKMNSRYAQTMRTNVYGGVIRADLRRVGVDDYWYLQNSADGSQSAERLVVGERGRAERQKALIKAIADFITAPSGAKMAGWAPHVFLTEGAILLTSRRTASFVSPIKVDVGVSDNPVQVNTGYSAAMKRLGERSDTWVWEFTDVTTLLGSLDGINEKLDEKSNGKAQSEQDQGSN